MLLGRTDAQWNCPHSMVFYRLVLTVATMFMLAALIPAGFIQWRECGGSLHSELIFNFGFVLAVALPLGRCWPPLKYSPGRASTRHRQGAPRAMPP